MGSTFPSTLERTRPDDVAPATIRWQSWPLVDGARWSWLVIGGILAAGGLVTAVGGGWMLSIAATVGLAATCWRFFVPVRYEAGLLGVRQTALGRTRLVPWHAVRAYQLRATGVVLYQQAQPIGIDLLRSYFLPYPPDEDELLCVLRQQLSHAVELPM